MFLIEDSDRAILYTGDIRSEPWFVNSLVRNPNLIEYASGIRRLDKIYLDTSFTDNIGFQTKADGIAELLRKVALYPNDTIFHFQAWTYGYEEVWIALSRALRSPIHVDDYKLRIYNSLKAKQSDGRFSADVHVSPEAPALVGYMSGNTPQSGCLTSDCNVRLHSCERGNMCKAAQGASVVRIQPIIAHLADGTDLAEIGAGGGGGDLEREAELDLGLMQDLQAFTQMIGRLEANGGNADFISKAQRQIVNLALGSVNRRSNIPLHLDAANLEEAPSDLLEKAIQALARRDDNPICRPQETSDPVISLPRVIRFPYSRHSSYPELCHLLEAFRPADVWPCTVHEMQWREQGISISSLFGKYCSGNTHCFDENVLQTAEWNEAEKELRAMTQASQVSVDLPAPDCVSPNQGAQAPNATPDSQHLPPMADMDMAVDDTQLNTPPMAPLQRIDSSLAGSRGAKRAYDDYEDDDDETYEEETLSQDKVQPYGRPFTSSLSTRHSIAQREAYYNMLEYMENDIWTPIGLMSTGNNHTEMDKEL